jgi:hypothetical protein
MAYLILGDWLCDETPYLLEKIEKEHLVKIKQKEKI